MHKTLLLLRAPAGFSRGALWTEVVERLAPRLLAAEPLAAKVCLTTPQPPRRSLIPLKRDRQLALFSCYARDGAAGERLAEQAAAALPSAWQLHGYRVAESLPLQYQRDWPLGQRTPGAGLLTLFRKKPGLSTETFLQRWHGGHTPLSLRIHPLWNYVRNVVQEPLVAHSPRWDGIVEEHFRSREDLLDVARFFGGWSAMLPNMLRVARDIWGFIDLRTIETYLVDEVHLR
jgi:hypothetical protein